MTTRKWILTLRADHEAWEDYLAWLSEQRQIVLEEDPANWDKEKERKGKKIMLDIIKNISTLDQKNELTRNKLYGVGNA